MIKNLDKAIKESKIEKLDTVIKKIEKELSEIFKSFNVKNLNEQDKDRIIASLIDESSSDFKNIYESQFKNFYKKYRDIGLKLDDLRSTFLPIDLIRSVKSTFSQKSENFGNSGIGESAKNVLLDQINLEKFLKESYENCFFRMLGMPESKSLKEESFYYVDIKEGLKKEDSDSKARLSKILEQRQNIFLRDYFPDNDFFNISVSIGSDSVLDKLPSKTATIIRNITKKFIDEKDVVESSRNDNSSPDVKSTKSVYIKTLKDGLANESGFNLITKEDYEKLYNDLYLGYVEESDLLNIPESFSKQLHLLFPPVQDSSVKSCISEPGKFISMPFTNNATDVISGEKINISLLESVIRIRLDQLTGYDNSDVLKLSNKYTEFSFPEVADTYGLVELLITNRLITAIEVLADKIDKDVDEYYLNAIKVQKSTFKNDKTGPDEEDILPDVAERMSLSANIDVPEEKNVQDKYIFLEKKSLQLLKNIDDTIGILLSDNKSLDVQSNTFRTSTLKDALFMDIISSLSTVSGDYASARLNKIQSRSNSVQKDKIERPRAEIAISLGIGRGVGLITVLCFSLAMFTLEEKYLLGLLNDKQFDKLKNEYPTADFFKSFKRPSIPLSLEAYSLKVLEAYELFTNNLASM
ncbi:hypothetical protein N9W84_00340 [bacterium]|nr:hypothetical protein [bacterium]